MRRGAKRLGANTAWFISCALLLKIIVNQVSAFCSACGSSRIWQRMSSLKRTQVIRGQSQVPEVGTWSQDRLAPERELGKVEYKLKLTAQEGSERFEQLVSQLNWRMRECGADEECEVEVLSQYRDALYRIGVADDGSIIGLSEEELTDSLKVLTAMAARIPATVTVVSKKVGIAPGNKTCISALVRACSGSDDLQGKAGSDVRICTVGNVDSGKSTLLGVLTHGLQDDGRGRARSSVFQHRHELESGRTSSIASLLLGFDVNGHVVNYEEDVQRMFRGEEPQQNAGRAEAKARVVERSSKLITFADLCGHEKYFKTTLQGLVGLSPDYLLCTLDANRGEMRGMVQEHLIVANALAIPTIICLTKCDMASEEARKSAMADIKKFLKDKGTPAFVVKDSHDVVIAAERIHQGYAPIFECSAVTGKMIPEMKLLLNLLSKRSPSQTCDAGLLIQVEDFFQSVPGVGLVISGRVLQGSVSVGDSVRLGPYTGRDGHLIKDGYVPLRISSMRFEGIPVDRLTPGSSGTFALKAAGKLKDALTTKALRRARVLLGSKASTKPARWLRAKVTILQHPSTIRPKYEPVLQIGMARQSAQIVAMTHASSGKDVSMLRAGDSAEVLFRWSHWPEVIKLGSAVVFRENLVKGIGKVTWVGEVEGFETKRASTKTASTKWPSTKWPSKKTRKPAAKSRSNSLAQSKAQGNTPTSALRERKAVKASAKDKNAKKGKRLKR
eukprot:TRINITY_DN53226_c0_g1_i1.p1 TRINITY_DN53226_c0_g1~~TRINITY_DN53226_c0_g1_i1.p1  ORF type:complete len:728 (-),score=134.13 TRINITY_DN53226_c0_g1_i1:11-2194(-)